MSGFRRCPWKACTLPLIIALLTGLTARAQSAVVSGKDIPNALMRQFTKFDVIALGELHGSLADQALRFQLIHHKDFAARVGLIVVEGLNSLYQPDLDRYVSGEDVSRERMQRVWRDGTQVFAGPVMLTAYELFLREVRSVNQSLTKGGKLRVLAADPPIDWTAVRTREEFLPFLRNRVDFGAQLIAGEVLRKGRKALLVFGLSHFARNQQMKTAQGFVPLEPTIGGLIDAQFPGRLFVVTPIRGAEYPDSGKFERLMGTTGRPVLLRLGGTPFGVLDPNQFIPANSSLLLGAPAPAFPPFRDGARMADVADACIYRGRSADEVVKPDPVYESDQPYAAEIQRRIRIAMPPRK